MVRASEAEGLVDPDRVRLAAQLRCSGPAESEGALRQPVDDLARDGRRLVPKSLLAASMRLAVLTLSPMTENCRCAGWPRSPTTTGP